MKQLLFAALALCLAACASTQATPQSPAQIIYAVSGDYSAALSVAVAYRRLPDCGLHTTPICSDKAVIANLITADAVAWAAIEDAQTSIRSLNNPDRVQAYVGVATAQVKAFVAITSGLKVSP